MGVFVIKYLNYSFSDIFRQKFVIKCIFYWLTVVLYFIHKLALTADINKSWRDSFFDSPSTLKILPTIYHNISTIRIQLISGPSTSDTTKA